MTTALITGATAGIGREFATQLARRNHHLVLVARDAERLEAVAAELRAAHGVDVEVLPADLSDRAALQRVADRLSAPGDPVEVLVNNAGYGLKGSFLSHDIDVEERLFDVLTRAVLVLSHAGARAMKARGRGTIINVSSVAGFIASGTYSAAKSWVTVFTEGLAAELAGTGVTATALCPGFTATEFHERAALAKTGPAFMWLDAADLVSACLADVARGRVVSVPGAQYKAIVGLLRVVPRSAVRGRVARVQRRR
ncbi:short-chain dehydrogenase [Intrasporangium oryzae NRRL B-24470]|uniref:Short-chain dehydrogenase n=1 Tax=Intrasporangium oryzae NRRL B-24470 TaxID=1386089 RepID=W9G7K1_9MICO|nr:SDR family oxidoreductase [Intrasporangium oryzae]EWT01257.1 short-chain dehydrogenase [Intrasporangium oryzae NRRL B-24470]